jgi:RNA polymerase sigma-70 factor, ECF subfamily
VRKKHAVQFDDELEASAMMTTERGNHPAPSPETSAEAGVMQQHIERALESLSPQERSVFVLRHYNDLPLKEIAATLEIAEGTVKAYLFRAIKRLQKELKFYGPEFGLEER